MTEMAVDSVDRARVEAGWNRPRGTPSLSEVFGSIATRPSGSFWRKLLTFLGPGYLVCRLLLEKKKKRPTQSIRVVPTRLSRHSTTAQLRVLPRRLKQT